MCVGIPMQILSVDGIAAHASDGTQTHLIDVSLIDGAAPGVWVLTFLGAARDVIDEAYALKIKSALAGLQSLMEGGELGDAFADLENNSPTLPPHLQAALDQGKTTG